MPDLSFLVVGYDRYKDVWDNFFKLLEIHWKNRSFDFYLVSNFTNIKYSNVTTIVTNSNMEFSSKLAFAISIIDSKYICILLEDFFIYKNLEDSSIDSIFNFMDKMSIDYLKLLNQNTSLLNFELIKDNFYKALKIEEYTISLQPSIWKKSFLAQILPSKKLNPWQFEFYLNNLKLEKNSNIFYLSKNPLSFIHTIVQGKYLPITKKYFSGIISFNRPFLYGFDLLFYYFKQKLSFITSMKTKKKLRKFAKFLKIPLISNIFNSEEL
jgi:hypothetical protein